MPHRTRDLTPERIRTVIAIAHIAAEAYVLTHTHSPRTVDIQIVFTTACATYPDLADWEARPYFVKIFLGEVEALQ